MTKTMLWWWYMSYTYIAYHMKCHIICHIVTWWEENLKLPDVDDNCTFEEQELSDTYLKTANIEK